MRSGNYCCGLSVPESTQVCHTFNTLLTHFYFTTKTHHITLTLEGILQNQIPLPWTLTVNTDLFQIHRYLRHLKCTAYDPYNYYLVTIKQAFMPLFI